MKFILAALFLPTISAFTPASKVSAQKSSSTVVKSYENAAGATAPIGYWDPLNLTSDKSQDQFDKARVGEIKNGRAAMLGVIGYIVPEFYRFPGELAPGLKFADIPNGIDAINAIPGQVSFFLRIECLCARYTAAHDSSKQPHKVLGRHVLCHRCRGLHDQ